MTRVDADAPLSRALPRLLKGCGFEVETFPYDQRPMVARQVRL